MKSGFFDKLLERVDRVEPGEVQTNLSRLMREKGLLEKVFEALQEGVLVCDPGGRLLYINTAARRLFGLGESGLVGEPLSTVIRGMDWAALAEELEPGGVVSRDIEIFYPENRFLNFYLAPIDDDVDEASYVVLVRDITQTRRLTEETIESERLNALTMLAAGVAHELGNPLNSLNIHLQLLDRKLKTSAPEAYSKVEESLAVARGEIKRLDFIIEQFLGAIRPASPQLSLIDLNRLITEAVRFLEPELEDRGIHHTLELHANVPLMKLDPDQMKQALYNLIRNAAQAMGRDGELVVRSNVDDHEVRVRVSDTGTGIPAEKVGSVFEPFESSKPAGTGLGLLIVRRIVREHGGEIGLQSEEGVGTSVTIHLPRHEKTMRMLNAPEDQDLNQDEGEAS